MSKIKSVFPIRVLCRMALLIALEIVLNRFLSINNQVIKIGFAFVPIVLCAVLFGPVHAAIVYAIADTIGALLFPIGPFMPGLTLSCALMGLMHGVFLRPLMKSGKPGFRISNFIRIICPVVINCVLLGLLLNTFWLSLVYTNRSFYYFFTMRLVEYAVLIPVQIIMIPFIITLAKRLRKAGIA